MYLDRFEKQFWRSKNMISLDLPSDHDAQMEQAHACDEAAGPPPSDEAPEAPDPAAAASLERFLQGAPEGTQPWKVGGHCLLEFPEESEEHPPLLFCSTCGCYATVATGARGLQDSCLGSAHSRDGPGKKKSSSFCKL